MERNANLYQKVLSLIIEFHSLETSNSGRVQLCSDAELESLFDNLVASIENKVAAYQQETASVEQPLDEPVKSSAESAEPDIPQQESVTSASPSQEIVAGEEVNVVVPVPQVTEPVEEVSAMEDKNWQPAPFPSLEGHHVSPAPLSDPTALRPGQIPTGASSLPVKISEPLPRVAKINIANARAGTPFHSEIDIALDNGEVASIQSVEFAKDIGVTFDPISSALKGTPLESGDIEMVINWSGINGQIHSDKAIFIVNPDPRSLWKIIDPPVNDKYFKENIDHQLLHEQSIRIAAASRRGRSHEHVGSFRDDDFYLSHCPDTGWSIMLVADGAGSAKNSRQGSRIVAETVGQYLTKYLGGERGHELSEKVKNWEQTDQQNIGAAFRHQFHQASTIAVNNLKNESIAAEEAVKSYSTTLLVAVTYSCGDELFAASFWMGDGAIAAYGPAGKVRVLGTPDSGEYAGQTRFLDEDAVQDSEFSKRVSIGKWKDISHLILMTDGVSDPFFETDNGLLKAEKWDVLVRELSPVLNDIDKTSEQLAEWLNFFIPGNHDDRTIVVYW
ncbi:PP2C family serine/threonine-protein phosphatase [Yersinia intermedia]|uniref:PPM-type phosphatase domain-containing protein n=1 Tax=Yersinia intermedia TaxID=631 RepID=A0A0T9MU27_YERIN|nr:PP2C family serine/threonine-protein phosphatase [Yersinia intermedia]CNG47236.1 Uncharacterised protein [Yersinia intermedia]